MNYTHEWTNLDWARYAAFYKNGVVVELEDKPTINDEGIISILSTSTGRSSIVESVEHQTEATIIQRYTDQQMELEAQGWTLFEIGCGDVHLPYPNLRRIDVISIDRKTFYIDTHCFWADPEVKGSQVIAYRLSNADGYKDGVKVESNLYDQLAAVAGGFGEDLRGSNDKPEWKVGELPPIGTVCEISDSDESMHKELRIGDQVTIIAHYKCNGFDVAAFTFAIAGGLLVDSAMKDYFKPIQSERDKVIAKATKGDTLAYACANIDTYRAWAEDLYDRGMLIDPGKGES